MKNLIFAFLVLCLVCCGCAKKNPQEDTLLQIQKRGKLIVGVREDAAPFGFRNEKGELQGYDIDLAGYIAEGILGSEKSVEFVPVTASNRIMKLGSAEVDILVATMSITNQRQQILDFSMPYYIAGQAILVNSYAKEASLRDFEGKKLIVVFGSTGERNLRTNVPEVEVVGYKTYDEAYKALKAGKATGILADDTILMRYVFRDKNVKLLKKRYSKEPYAVAFRKEDESKKLIDKVDFIIEELQNSRKLFRLQEKWNIKND